MNSYFEVIGVARYEEDNVGSVRNSNKGVEALLNLARYEVANYYTDEMSELELAFEVANPGIECTIEGTPIHKMIEEGAYVYAPQYNVTLTLGDDEMTTCVMRGNATEFRNKALTYSDDHYVKIFRKSNNDVLVQAMTTLATHILKYLATNDTHFNATVTHKANSIVLELS